MSRIKRDQLGNFTKHIKPNICSIAECNNPVRCRGLCNMHFLRFQRHGDPTFRKKAANGEGGISRNGYMMITVDGKRILEHRHIMEKHLGRKLLTTEIVHHIDGNKLNNVIDNLIICTRRDHVFIHPESLDNLSLGPQSRRGTI